MKNEKDWTGNKRTVFSILGASNHSETDRQTEDFYATSPSAIDALKSKVDLPHFILEPACGQGHLSERLKAMGHEVWSYDVVDRGYGEVQNFFELLTLPDSLSLSAKWAFREIGGGHEPALQVRLGVHYSRSGAVP